MAHRSRTGAAAGLGLLLAVLPACYESEKPLDPTPQVDIDPALLGAWRCIGGTPAADENAFSMNMEASDKRLYRATVQDNAQASVYEAYASRVGTATVLNVRERKADGTASDWCFVRYTLPRPQVLLIELVDKDGLKGVDPSPASLKKALAVRARAKDLYSLLCACTRARQG